MKDNYGKQEMGKATQMLLTAWLAKVVRMRLVLLRTTTA
jgi:hypothetical protein